MNIVKMPGFTGDQALNTHPGSYRRGRSATAGPNMVVPAIPACSNCDAILERCEANNWRPRAVCNACARGYCYEEPPMPDPYPNPWDSGPPHWIYG